MVFLGKILKIRGNKGEVVLTTSPSRGTASLRKGDEVLLKSNKYEKIKTLLYSIKIHDGFILKFSDVHTISDAYKLIGYGVYSSNVQEKRDSSSNYQGFAVIDGDGKTWGIVKKIQHDKVNAIMEVDDGKDLVLVPYNPTIIRHIDIKNRRITIDPPAGLRELNKS